MTVEEMMNAAGRELQPLANGEIIDYTNVPSVIAKFVRSDRMPAGQTGRPWMKHLFRMPNGEYFALGGCLQLDTRLRGAKPNDILFLTYDGQKDIGGGKTEHQWRVVLVTATGATLDGMIGQLLPVYEMIVAATEQRRKERSGAGQPDEPPPHTDDDAPYKRW